MICACVARGTCSDAAAWASQMAGCAQFQAFMRLQEATAQLIEVPHAASHFKRAKCERVKGLLRALVGPGGSIAGAALRAVRALSVAGCRTTDAQRIPGDRYL